MTNEEAIKAMTKYMPKDNDSVSLVLREAMNLGIKALEQEPTTKGNLVVEDCISRKAVLNTLDSMDKALTEDRTVEEYKEVLEECYKVLPSIQPKPKTEALNKIRDEITNLDYADYDYEGYYKAVTDAVKIIDKYTAESEDKE